jgi:hypothetical protein
VTGRGTSFEPAMAFHLTGGGYARHALIYKYTAPEQRYEFATEKVTIRLFGISMILCICIGTIVATVLRFRVSLSISKKYKIFNPIFY